MGSMDEKMKELTMREKIVAVKERELAISAIDNMYSVLVTRDKEHIANKERLKKKLKRSSKLADERVISRNREIENLTVKYDMARQRVDALEKEILKYRENYTRAEALQTVVAQKESIILFQIEQIKQLQKEVDKKAEYAQLQEQALAAQGTQIIGLHNEAAKRTEAIKVLQQQLESQIIQEELKQAEAEGKISTLEALIKDAGSEIEKHKETSVKNLKTIENLITVCKCLASNCFRFIADISVLLADNRLLVKCSVCKNENLLNLDRAIEIENGLHVTKALIEGIVKELGVEYNEITGGKVK